MRTARLAIALLASGLALTSTPGRAAPAQCDLMTADAAVTRNELIRGARKPDAQMLLRFLHLTDDHIIDDDGQAVIGASFLDPVAPLLEASMRFQEEYSDEVLNDLTGRINACTAQFPAEFGIVTGDSADLTTVAEIRRFIDNLDGTFDRMSAFEEACRADLRPGTREGAARRRCTRFTGRDVADTQTPDPNPSQLLFQPILTRMLLQLAATELAATTGRAENGGVSLLRQTITRSPGLPESLRCHHTAPGCANNRLNTPWYMVFGNHDAYVRGTLPIDLPLSQVAEVTGRHYMVRQHEFIREFFNSSATPGPVGHGFNFVERRRFNDDDGRNDGYYAFDAGDGRFRMIVMNTIVDGVIDRLPPELIRNPFALADGSMDRAQFEWVDRQLRGALRNGQLAMVFSHHPDLSFAEYGLLAPLVPIEVTAVELNGLLASYPNLIAWVAGHTHRHRVRPFKVENGIGSNGTIASPVACKRGNQCRGFWQIETASLIDFPQEQRLVEIFDNGDGTGTIRGPILGHGFDRARDLAEADDRCAFYLADPRSIRSLLTEADLGALCSQGGTRVGEARDRNVELMFRMPRF
ncbi:MAG: hypothetical protein ACT4QA_12960 [Panacagrimonas sp.]